MESILILQLFDSVLLTQSQGHGGGSGKKTEETLLEIASDILSKVIFSLISSVSDVAVFACLCLSLLHPLKI